MTSAPVTPLRQRKIEDMTIRGYTATTQQNYLRAVADFAQFLRARPTG